MVNLLFVFVQTSQVPFPASTALLRCRLPADIHHPDMESQLGTTTVVETVTITNGPEINNQQFQGWYIHTDDSSLEAINCPSSQSLLQTSNYAQCCNIGAVTCSVFWTSCHGANPVGIRTDTCGSNLFCQTVSIFDQFPVNQALVHSQIICGPSAWVASSIYRRVISTSTSTSLSTITPASPSGRLTSTTPASTQTNPTSNPAPGSSPSQAWIAGAVVGPIFGIAIVVLLAWLLFRSRRKRLQNNGPSNGVVPGEYLYTQNVPTSSPHFAHEAYGSNDVQQKVHEMHARHSEDGMHELPAQEVTEQR